MSLAFVPVAQSSAGVAANVQSQRFLASQARPPAQPPERPRAVHRLDGQSGPSLAGKPAWCGESVSGARTRDFQWKSGPPHRCPSPLPALRASRSAVRWRPRLLAQTDSLVRFAVPAACPACPARRPLALTAPCGAPASYLAALPGRRAAFSPSPLFTRPLKPGHGQSGSAAHTFSCPIVAPT